MPERIQKYRVRLANMCHHLLAVTLPGISCLIHLFIKCAGFPQAEGAISVRSAVVDTKAAQAEAVQGDKVIQTPPEFLCAPDYVIPVPSPNT